MGPPAPRREARVRLLSVLVALGLLGAGLGVAVERVTAPDLEELVSELGAASTDPVLAQPSPPPPSSRSIALAGLPPYPGATPLTLDDELTVFGMPMAVAWFQTRDTPEQLVSFYEKALGEAGFPVVSHLFGPASGYAGWLDYKSGQLHLVSALAQGEDTLVFVSLSEPGRLDLREGQVPQEVPVPKGAHGLQVLRLGTEGRAVLMVSAKLGAPSVDAATASVREDLVSRGWAVAQERLTLNEARVSGRKDGQAVSVVLTRDRAPDQVGVLITFNGS